MYVDGARRNVRDIAKNVRNTKGSSRAGLPRAVSRPSGWQTVAESHPTVIALNEVSLGPWRLPDDYKKAATSLTGVINPCETVVRSNLAPKSRSKGVVGNVVQTPHSILPAPLDFLPILFRQARLLDQAMSVLEGLSPAFAAQRRQLLCHCGEGFADPESAATAIATEDKTAPPRAASMHEEPEAAPPLPGTDPNVKPRPVSAPINVHRRRPNWMRGSEGTQF